MRVIFLFVSFLVLALTSFSQKKSAITGSWKVVSVFDGDIYFNLKTDSVYISPDMQARYPDTAVQKNLIANAKAIYGKMQFHFQSNGIFKQSRGAAFLFSSQFTDIPSKGIIEITSDNSLGEKVTDQIKYELRENQLYLSLQWDESNFDYVLEKFN